jgi:RNA polymerase sigma-70 factor (ECF subfamily)
MSEPNQRIKRLYDDYADPIYRFIYWHTNDPLLAEDLMSEVFFRAWKFRDKLVEGNQRAWLYRVARNLIIDHYRRKKDEILDEAVEIESDYNLHAEAEKFETSQHLHKALATLSLEDQSIIILRFFEQLAAKEVAAIIRTSEGNVRVLQHRALKLLQRRLRNDQN